MNYTKKSFSVGSTSAEAQDKFRSNYDKAFGKKKRVAECGSTTSGTSEKTAGLVGPSKSVKSGKRNGN